MNKWNVQGWDSLVGDKPGIVAAREELMRWLKNVPGVERDKWHNRLKSKNHHHFSVRLELYLHHFFRERGWEIDIEPELAGASDRPDFRLRQGEYEILVEAKTLLDPESAEKQDTHLKSLADGLSEKLKRTVSIHPLSDLPPNLSYKDIASAIEKKAGAVEPVQKFRIAGEHVGCPYELEVTIVLEDKPTPYTDVGITVGQAQDANPGQRMRMREAIIGKGRTSKYGKLDTSLVIIVWPQTSLYSPGPDNDDRIALSGDMDWREVFPGGFREFSEPNGVFNLKNSDGARRYSRISAVGIYLFSWDSRDNPRHELYVYHNPYADHPVSHSVFQGIPQGVCNISTGQLEWLDNLRPRGANVFVSTDPKDGEGIYTHHPKDGGTVLHKDGCVELNHIDGHPELWRWGLWGSEEEARKHSEEPIERCCKCFPSNCV